MTRAVSSRAFFDAIRRVAPGLVPDHPGLGTVLALCRYQQVFHGFRLHRWQTCDDETMPWALTLRAAGLLDHRVRFLPQFRRSVRLTP